MFIIKKKKEAEVTNKMLAKEDKLCITFSLYAYHLLPNNRMRRFESCMDWEQVLDRSTCLTQACSIVFHYVLEEVYIWMVRKPYRYLSNMSWKWVPRKN